MYLGRPCLALTAEGALADLVRHHALGEVIHPRDPEAICAALTRRLHSFRDAGAPALDAAATHAVGIDRFHRRRLAGEFARIFRAAADAARAADTQPARVAPTAFVK
jgi:hypothetical protein